VAPGRTAATDRQAERAEAEMEPYSFQGSGLNRAAHLRAGIDAQRRRPGARMLAFWRGKVAAEGEAGAELAWLDPGHPALAAADPVLFLGEDADGPLLAADISAWEPEGQDVATLGAFLDPSEQIHPDLPDGIRFVELRRVMTGLSPRDGETGAMARALFEWHRGHRFCPRCGGPSVAAPGGWQRNCPACGAEQHPRTDPVVIMLVTRGNKVLLGRSPHWPERMYSLLAGFVEPGETPEAAVRREVMEEAGVPVGRVRYLASQPWPFPMQLMIACHAEALDDRITLDPAELQDARWIEREDLALALAGGHPDIAPARPGAVARAVMTHWLGDRLDRLSLDAAGPEGAMIFAGRDRAGACD